MHYNIVNLMKDFSLIGDEKKPARPPCKLSDSNNDAFGRDIQVCQYGAGKED